GRRYGHPPCAVPRIHAGGTNGDAGLGLVRASDTRAIAGRRGPGTSAHAGDLAVFEPQALRRHVFREEVTADDNEISRQRRDRKSTLRFGTGVQSIVDGDPATITVVADVYPWLRPARRHRQRSGGARHAGTAGRECRFAFHRRRTIGRRPAAPLVLALEQLET